MIFLPKKFYRNSDEAKLTHVTRFLDESATALFVFHLKNITESVFFVACQCLRFAGPSVKDDPIRSCRKPIVTALYGNDGWQVLINFRGRL